MTTRQLAFKGPPSLAVAAGATTPNPGIAGVQVWSTTTSSILTWDGSQWAAAASGAPTSDSILAPVDMDVPNGHSWWADGFNNYGWSTSGGNGSLLGLGVAVAATPASTGLDGTFPHSTFTTTAATYQAAGMFVSERREFKRGSAAHGGFVFEALCGFEAANGCMFIGMQAGSLLYADTPANTAQAIGIGNSVGDNSLTTFRVFFGNGTAFSSTPYSRPAGTRNAPFYKVYIRVLPGASIAKMWVIDYGIAGSPEGIMALNGLEIDISSLPVAANLEPTMGVGTAGQTNARSFRGYWMKAHHWRANAPYAEAAANITGNANTATALATPRLINGVAFDGTQDITIGGGGGGSQATLILTSETPDVPAANEVVLFRRDIAGREMLAIMGPSGLDTTLQPHWGRNKVATWNPAGNGTVIVANGAAALTATGTATAANVATTNRHTRQKRLDYLVTTAAATAVAGFRYAAAQWTIGAATAGDGGFHMIFRWAPATGVATATNRCFVGMANTTAAPTDVEPSTITNIVGVGWDAADANIQIMHRGTGAITKVNLGASFPVPTTDRTESYEIALFSPPGTTQQVGWTFTNNVTGVAASGVITTNMPTNTTLLAPRGWMSVGGTSSVIGIALMSGYIESDY